jgi:hypothetical protein
MPLILLVLLLSLLSIAPAQARGGCPPVPLEHWSYDSIGYIVDAGFLPPVYAGQFTPGEELTVCDMREYARLIKQVFDTGQPASLSDEDWLAAFDTARLFVEEYGLLLKGDPYQQVPAGHWSYAALDYVLQAGMLDDYPDDYPDDFFDGKHLLTRAEMGKATAQFLDQLGSQNENQVLIVIGESLYVEYSDQFWSSEDYGRLIRLGSTLFWN